MATYLCICTKTREEAVIETVAKEADWMDGYIYGRITGNHPLKGWLFAKPNSKQSKRWEAMDYYEHPTSKHATRFLVEHERPRAVKSVTLFHSRLAEAYEEAKQKAAA